MSVSKAAAEGSQQGSEGQGGGAPCISFQELWKRYRDEGEVSCDSDRQQNSYLGLETLASLQFLVAIYGNFLP